MWNSVAKTFKKIKCMKYEHSKKPKHFAYKLYVWAHVKN